MGSVLSYSLATSLLVLLLFPVLYRLVNRSTSFVFNRFAILGAMLLSLASPCFLLDRVLPEGSIYEYSGEVHVPHVFADTTAVANVSEGPSVGMYIIMVLLLVYFIGVVALLLRELVSYVRLYRLISACDRTVCDGFVLCRTKNTDIAPFSWGRYIVLPGEDECPDSIIRHELAHTDQQHWIDVLLADMFCIFLWYNPFAWMTKSLAKLNHEFSADYAVVRSGVDVESYQRLLIAKAVGRRTMPHVNSLASGSENFRKRVLMMSKKRTSGRAMLLAFCFVPALALSAFAVSTPLASGWLSAISDYELFLPNNGHAPEVTQQEVVAEEDAIADTPQSDIIELPSPHKDPSWLTDILRVALSNISSNEEMKINLEIVVDEEGRIVDVGIGEGDDHGIKLAVEEASNSVRFEKVLSDGQPIKMHYVVPVTIK